MPIKDYTNWNIRKAQINSSLSRVYFYEREVWWTAIGHNVGDEEDGKGYNFARPVLILRKFNQSLFYGVPLSTTKKRGRYYHELTVNGESRTALLSHMRDYDVKRLINRLDFISELDYARLQLVLINLLKEPAQLHPKIFNSRQKRE